MSDSNGQQAQFSGWAKVEVMGHQSHIGYVKTEVYGGAVLFRIDTPELPDREYVLTEPAYIGGQWTPAGATVRRVAIPGVSVLVGAGSIYRILPCDQAAALQAIEQSIRSELKVIGLPAEKQLEVRFPETPVFTCCGGNPQDGHTDECPYENEGDEPE